MKKITTIIATVLLISCNTAEEVKEYTPEQLKLIKQIEYYEAEGKRIEAQQEKHRKAVDNTIRQFDRDIKLNEAKGL